MALPSFLRRKASTAPVERAAAAGSVDAARARARRRLIGAVVLLGVGIVAFPLLFETEPRPIPVDLPIEIPAKEGAPPLVMPSASGVVAAVPAVPPPAGATEAAPAAAASAPVANEPAASAPARSAPPAAARDDGARAKALLDGRAASAPAAAPAPARYVVQVGAFAESRTVLDVRAKVERLGLKTYTQVVTVQAGERTRVRVGPFADRDEAEATAARLKKAGLPAAVLTP
ncbi:MAG: SPOR domain-containing protein [Rubrivivax sp.]|nr:SPOR domain-containing protein [Rubrivivax sp.]